MLGNWHGVFIAFFPVTCRAGSFSGKRGKGTLQKVNSSTLLLQIFSKKKNVNCHLSLFCPINHKVLPTPKPPHPQPLPRSAPVNPSSLDLPQQSPERPSSTRHVITVKHATTRLKTLHWLTVIHLKKGKYLGSKDHIYHLLSNSLGRKIYFYVQLAYIYHAYIYAYMLRYMHFAYLLHI